jgi:hypothetical protein
MPNLNNVSNTDKPFVRNPRHEDQVAASSPDLVREAESRSLQEMHDQLGRQADRVAGEAGKRVEEDGLVTREELNQIIAQHQAQMQSIMAVFEMFKRDDPRRDSPVTADALATERDVYERTIKALQEAPKVAVYIAPYSFEAEAIQQNGGEPIYRVTQLNGINYPVAVGQVVEVPEPIAEIIRNARDIGAGRWSRNPLGPPILFNEKSPAQALESIPRPAPQPMAEEFGRSGVVGHDVFRPFNNEAPRALDAR